MNCWYCDHLAFGRHDDDVAARPAAVVGVDAVVGLPLPDELERLVLALGHWRGPDGDGLYAFGLVARGTETYGPK